MSTTQRFRRAYAEHRKREGRGEGISVEEYPYVNRGPFRGAWSVRARSFDHLVRHIVRPLETSNTPLSILDLGAGNGWFSLRMARRGHHAIAVDVRADDVDGLSAGNDQRDRVGGIGRVVADFSALPLTNDVADLCVFNASLHYTQSTRETLQEAVRVTRHGGKIVITDTPFYSRADDGEQMVKEKLGRSETLFGDLAAELTAIPFVEFLTRDRLMTAGEPFGLKWTRHRVRYPIWYELRPFLAWIKRSRAPSRFDVWVCSIP